MIPTEILFDVTSFLSAVGLKISRLVSRRWNAIILKSHENWPKKEIKEKATMQQGIVELYVQDRPKTLLSLDSTRIAISMN